MRIKSFIKIFVCFAPEDEKLYRGLERQLKAASRHRNIEWYSNEMSLGADWKEESEAHLRTADIILLLVSPDFMASDYCYFVQVKQAMDRHKRKEAIVVPVILRLTNWQHASFGKLKALPADAMPIVGGRWRTQEEAFFDVMKGILEVMGAAHAKYGEAKKRERFSEADILYKKPIASRPELPRGMGQCPSCIEEFYINECNIVSAIDRMPIEAGKTGWLEKRMEPKSLTSPEYRELQACRECPHCKYLLPYNIELVDDNISIAVIGDIASGKSVYLAALLYHMKERWMNKNSPVQMKCLTENVETFFDHGYLIPLFRHNQDLPPTLPDIIEMNPLIYELTFPATSKSQEKRVNLIFYDGPGEHYARQESMEQFARYVLRASALIFLVDLGVIPEMGSRLPDYLQYPGRGSTAYHFLTSTIELLEEFYPSAFRSVPLAVMLSKSDLLNHVYAPKVPQLRCLLPSPLHYNPTPRREYIDLQDIRDIDGEVRTLIRETSEYPLLDVTQRFSQVNFFASSATGCAKDSSGYFPHIKPCRCLDPLFWILHQRKVILANRNYRGEIYRP